MIGRRSGLLGALAFILFLSAALPPALLIGGNLAAAQEKETGIQVQASLGYQGWNKDGRWYPLHLTLTNTTDEDLKGEVVVTARSDAGGGTVDYTAQVQLPKESPIQVDIAIPGIVFNKDAYSIHFYSGEAGKGKEVPVLGDVELANRVFSGDLIGIIADDADTLNFMPTLNQRGYNINTLSLTAEELPADALLLDSFDILVLNNISTGSWPKEKAAAVIEWVKKGGLLVLSGGAGYNKTAQAFRDIAPVDADAGDTIKLATADALQKAGDKSKPLSLAAPLAIASFQVKEAGQVILTEQEHPLAVKRQLGMGAVLSAAFDPALEPLASWAGSPDLWVKLMQQKLSLLQPGFGSARIVGNGFWEMDYIADMFPGIALPKFSVLMWSFILYLLVIGPLLFFVLRRFDRREWAWWLIPSFAILSSVVIFSIGASDKHTTMAHSVSTIELSGDGTGIETGAAAVFVPSGGTVTVQFDQPHGLLPYRNGGGFIGSGSADEQSGRIVERTAHGSTIQWQDVSFWSSRKTYIDRFIRDEAGRFKTAMKDIDGGANIKLEVSNDTAADLRDIHFLWLGKAYPVGDLAKGQRGEIKIPKGQPQQGVNYYDYTSQIFPYNGTARSDQRERERRLINAYFNNQMNRLSSASLSPSRPVVVGFSEDKQSRFSVNGEQVQSDQLTMWVQPVGAEFIDGDKIVIPAGMVVPILQNATMKERESRPDGWVVLSKGELEFEYSLRELQAANYKSLSIYAANFPGTQGLRLSVWNEQKGKWEELPKGGPEWQIAAEPYITSDEAIKMKYEVAAEERIEATLPQIALEGEVRKQ